MKCPNCFEPVHPAAIFCKHCGQLIATAARLTPLRSKRTPTRWLWIVPAAALVVLALWVYPSLGGYRTYVAKREAWHQRCDRYQGQPQENASLEAMGCAAEMKQLDADAQRHGW